MDMSCLSRSKIYTIINTEINKPLAIYLVIPRHIYINIYILNIYYLVILNRYLLSGVWQPLAQNHETSPPTTRRAGNSLRIDPALGDTWHC